MKISQNVHNVKCMDSQITVCKDCGHVDEETETAEGGGGGRGWEEGKKRFGKTDKEWKNFVEK